MKLCFSWRWVFVWLIDRPIFQKFHGFISIFQALNEEYAEKLKRYETGNVQEQSVSSDATADKDLETNDSMRESSSVDATNVESDDAIEEIESKKCELKDLVEKITLKENELNYLVQKVVLQENEFNDLMQKTVQKESLLNDLVEKIGVKERNLDDIMQQTTQKKSELEELIQRRTAQERQLNDLVQNIDAKQGELKDFIIKATTQETIEQKFKDEQSQFQLNLDDLTDQVNRLNVQLSEKDRLCSRNIQALLTFLKTVCHFMSERNRIVDSVAAGTETLKNAEGILRKHEIIESPALSEEFEGRRQLEDELITLREQIEKIIVTNVTLLEKLETLTEIIKKKDTLLEEIAIERDTWRQECKEVAESKTNEIKQMECRFADLNKVWVIYCWFNAFLSLSTLCLQLRILHEIILNTFLLCMSLFNGSYNWLQIRKLSLIILRVYVPIHLSNDFIHLQVKIDIENQLQKSEENVKKLELSILNANETNQNELLNIRKDLELKSLAHIQLSKEINNLKSELIRANGENDRLESEIRLVMNELVLKLCILFIFLFVRYRK